MKQEPNPGEIVVKVGAFPGGKIKQHSLPAGSTVLAAMTKAGHQNAEGLDVRLNGKTVTDLQTTIENGAQILIYTKVRGN